MFHQTKLLFCGLAVFFVQEDHTVVSSTHAGVQTFRSLLHQKFLTAQVILSSLFSRRLFIDLFY